MGDTDVKKAAWRLVSAFVVRAVKPGRHCLDDVGMMREQERGRQAVSMQTPE